MKRERIGADEAGSDKARSLTDTIISLLDRQRPVVAATTIAAVAAGFIAMEGVSRDEMTARKETLFKMIETFLSFYDEDPAT